MAEERGVMEPIRLPREFRIIARREAKLAAIAFAQKVAAEVPPAEAIERMEAEAQRISVQLDAVERSRIQLTAKRTALLKIRATLAQYYRPPRTKKEDRQ